MKRLALVAAVLAVAACSTENKAEVKDTTTPAMAPAPAAAATDSAAKMDSSMKMDSAKKDTVKKDSAAKAAPKATKKP